MIPLGSTARKWLADLREESTLLIAYNFLWVVTSLPGLLLIGYGAVARALPLLGLGLVLLLPFPIITFGMFHAMADLVAGKPIALGTIFTSGWQWRGRAFRWAGLNLLVIAILLANMRYYGSGASPLGDSLLASLIASLITTLTAMWILWQLFALARFPFPSSGGVLRVMSDTGRLFLRYPVPVFATALMAALLAGAGLVIPPFGLLFAVSSIAALASRVIAEILSPAGRGKRDSA